VLQNAFPEVDFRRFHHIDVRFPFTASGSREV